MCGFLHNTSIHKGQVLFFSLTFIFLLSFSELCLILTISMNLFSEHWGQIIERRQENEKVDSFIVHGVTALRMQ